ncbi:MAG: hypothetical protein MK085_07255 [Phycisphaerales bacterium]|nr:hypothetical protein [Phycisphaerales bacterium]
MKTMRRLFSRRNPIELSVNRRPHEAVDTEPLLADPDPFDQLEHAPVDMDAPLAHADREDPGEAPATMITRIEDALQEGRELGTSIVEAINKMPEITNNCLHTMNQRQGAMLDHLRDITEAEQTRIESEQEASRQLAEVLGTHAETLGLVQRQLDANHQVAASTAEHLEDMGRGLTESIATNRKTGEAMSALVDELRSTTARQDARFGRMQGWIIACVIACIAAVVASVTLAWVAIAN